MEDECIICFEHIDNELYYSLFECQHKKNMHLACIYNLQLCPLCRAPRTNAVHICVFVINEKNIRVCGTGLFLLLYFIFFTGLYIVYEDIKDEILRENSTIY